MLRSSGLVALAILAASPSAGADVLVLSADLQGGGMYGSAMAGEAPVKDQAFFADIPNTTYGAAVSARFLFLGATLQHHQYNDGDDLATWTQILAGLDFGVDLGTPEQKKAHRGGFVELKAGLGFGVGTGQQVDPPLSNDEISDKAVLVGAQLGFGKHLHKLWDAGIAIPVTYGYFLKNGVPANDLSNHYQGIQAEALLFLRLRLKVL